MRILLFTVGVTLAACTDVATDDSDTPPDASAPSVADTADVLDPGRNSVPDADPDSSPRRACNGSEALCNAPLDRIVFPGTHNSMASRENDFFAPNHEFGIAQQLEDGVRAMLLDTYFWEEEFYFCHGYCELGATLAAEGLGTIRTFLEDNPDELLVIIFQNGISPEETVEMLDAAQLTQYAMIPREADWPTAGELIDAGERLLMTLEFGAGPEWLPNAWDVFVDTPYSFSSPDEFTCEANRGSADNGLHLLNHWLSNPLPTPELGAIANTYEQLSARVEVCRSVGVFPNVVAVDFYATGALFEVVAELNAENAE